ncbi:putative Zinc finger, C2HC5-type, activating signal cointegrator 1 [Septoria linicola]|nr:putative Zinc finger, C2HC5-type, activating signal cointegrator 1 [Septoria linicola]
MAAKLESWALPRLQQLLPLDDESLKQIIAYSDSLPKDSAAEHLKNLLGDDAKSLEFISSFNMRRQQAPPSNIVNHSPSTSGAEQSEIPRRPKPQGKKKANIHALPARQLDGHGNVSGGYQKREEQSYMAGPSRQKHKDQVADNLALQSRQPDATQMPLITDDARPTTLPITSKPPPSASGPLISDSLSSKTGGARSSTSARTSSPAPRAKVNISGGTAMHGASTALSDLDSAIRSLEVQTNPSLTSNAEDDLKRKCNCMATRHPLLDMAPNCVNCGKVICVKEGLGPCTFCKSPLLGSEELQKVLRVLKDERGEERMKSNNAAHKKADVAHGKARAFTGRDFLAQTSSARSSPLSSAPATPAGSDDEATVKAKAHRDKLLGFQANNARRTQIHDEAADFDVPSAGTNMWASPQERAQQLKKQQRLLREMEWNAKPEYEKRHVVASIDVKAGKVVRRMAEVQKPGFGAADADDNQDDYVAPVTTTGGGAFSNNPLAKGLIRPTAREEKGEDTAREKRTAWRRVQMDQDDNEAWILDGGVYGSKRPDDVPLGEEEHAFG